MPKVSSFRHTPDLPKLEDETLEYWQKDQTFEKSVDQRPADKAYVFYDGPPFATGMPHYGHLLASTTKDVIPRYWTMKGYRVERRWGWDCHGLPIENIVEKELNLPDKKAIEDYGVDKFNEACRSRVLTYAHDWQRVIAKLGRWVDMKNDYKTMESWYMESLWWVFQQLWQRDLIYKGHKSMHICPRCSTPLSNFEVTQGYKEVKDQSVTVEFELKDAQQKLHTDKPVFALAWTTTPWTLPGNMLLAVSQDLTYVLFSSTEPGNLYLASQEFFEKNMADDQAKIVQKLTAQDLIGLSYQPLFPYYADTPNAFRVVQADFVSKEEGTGLVHIAPGFGEDDYEVGAKEGLPLVQHVGFDGKFTAEVTDFSGLPVKPKGNPASTDLLIVKYLQEHDSLFLHQKIKHSYPHCWRCDTPLLNYATDSWFVRVSGFVTELLANNQKINWVPDHLKDGRFGMWLKNAQDWAISRNRYWGTPLPIWESDDGDVICVGSIAELEELSGEKVTDLHKHHLDQIQLKKDGKVYQRIPEVLDCWFESGAMPYASYHYPFENKQKFEQNFPAEFISEGQDQTRGWFYTLHVLATALTMGDQPAIKIKDSTSAFKNVIVNGVVLAEDGKKMSKRLQNYPDPMKIIEQYGADALRLYLMSSSVMKAENLNFREKEVADLRRKVFLIWWNMISFYQLFADTRQDVQTQPVAEHVLDKWLVSQVNSLTQSVTQHMDEYDVVRASRSLIEFVNLFSTWYLRLSRERLKAEDNSQASHVFGWALYRLAQLFAPFCPFFSELVHHNLVDDKSSIHLGNWPKTDTELINQELETEMELVMNIVEAGRSLRRDQGVKLRHPLALAKVTAAHELSFPELESLIIEELNVKKLSWQLDKEAEPLSVDYDFKLTPELKQEAQARDLIREIQDLRRQAELGINDQAKLMLPDWPQAWQEEIESKTNTTLTKGDKMELKL